MARAEQRMGFAERAFFASEVKTRSCGACRQPGPQVPQAPQEPQASQSLQAPQVPPTSEAKKCAKKLLKIYRVRYIFYLCSKSIEYNEKNHHLTCARCRCDGQ